MPDWFYRTCSQPLLFALPVSAGRGLALGVMGTLARLPGGTAVIDFLGHMRPDPRLATPLNGVTFPTPVGLGAEIDPSGSALRAFRQFGIGFQEIGPVTVEARSASTPTTRWPTQLGWSTSDPPESLGLPFWKARLAALPKSVIPLVARVAIPPGTSPDEATRQCRQIIDELSPASVFALDTLKVAARENWSSEAWQAHVAAVREAIHANGKKLWLCLPVDLDPDDLQRWIDHCVEPNADGVMVDGVLRHEAGILHGTPGCDLAREVIRGLRAKCSGTEVCTGVPLAACPPVQAGSRSRTGGQAASGTPPETPSELLNRGTKSPGLTIVGSGGINSPGDALRFLEAGANLLRVDTGLVYAGPGLVKRINEAIVSTRSDAAIDEPDRHPAAAPLVEQSWLWSALLGVAMLLGALAALWIAGTRVVLPYDEDFVGLTRSQLIEANRKLIDFLTHDRVTLAGTMLAVSVLQIGLSVFGVRRGVHWARVALLSSSAVGFLTFFLFLGFGYFDPFHAFVTAILSQLFLMAVHTRLSPRTPSGPVTLEENEAFRAALWGQLLIILQGVAVLVAGLTISGFGITVVFVESDLEFLGTTHEALRAISPKLIPLVAHDRATFGGMLVCTGLATLMTGLWGFREGQAWVWWMLAVAGTCGYATTLFVHHGVGYTDPLHLAPAIAGLTELWVGLGLSYPWLCARGGPPA